MAWRTKPHGSETREGLAGPVGAWGHGRATSGPNQADHRGGGGAGHPARIAADAPAPDSRWCRRRMARAMAEHRTRLGSR